MVKGTKGLREGENLTYPQNTRCEYVAFLCSRPSVQDEESHPARGSPVELLNRTQWIYGSKP